MDREGFRNRMKQYKEARGLNPLLKYWEWRNSLPDNLKYTNDAEYDMQGAYEAGMLPEWNEQDQSYHLGSRDPRTGRILKKFGHPTYYKALEEDAKMGYKTYVIGNNTYTWHDKDGVFVPWLNQLTEEDIPKYGGGTGGVLDKNKVYNRVKGDLLGNVGYSIMDAVRQYLFNDDSTVDKYIETVKSAKNKYSNYDQNELDSLVTDSHKIYLNYLRASRDRSKTSPEYKDYSEKRNASRANFIITHEDAKDLYLGLPLRNNTVIQSKYKPSVGNASQTYYTFAPLLHEAAFQKPIVDAYNNMLQNKVFKVVDDGKFLGLSISTPEIENADSNVIDIPKQNRAVAKIPLFGNATVSTGVDPNKGQYVSVYDVWDYNTAIANKHGDNVGKYIGGTPFELYDRIYLDDYYGVSSKPNLGDYYGGYLPELSVTAEKYKEGGEVTGPPTYEDWLKSLIKNNLWMHPDYYMSHSLNTATKALKLASAKLPGREDMPPVPVPAEIKGEFPQEWVMNNLYNVENPRKKGVTKKYAKMYDSRTLGAGVDVVSGHPELYDKAKRFGIEKELADEIAYEHIVHDDQVIRDNYADIYGKAAADTLSFGPRFLVAQARYQLGNVRKGWDEIHKALAKGDAKALKKAVLKVTPEDHDYRKKWVKNFNVYGNEPE